MSYRVAIALMVATTLMWSSSGVITRYLDSDDGFEAVFWRGLFASLTLVVILGWRRGGRGLIRAIGSGGPVLWLSGCCWAVMFTAFMLALMLTQVANVLVTIALSPLLTAIFARVALGHRLPGRTTAAIALAGAGVFWMYGGELSGTDGRNVAGMAVALCIPIGGAINLTLLQYVARERVGAKPDMLLAVLVGSLLATLVSLPFALPFDVSAGDVGRFAILGSVALAVPCLLLIYVTRVLSAPEVSLYSLLEVVFGTTWVWVAVNESPSQSVLLGGCVVLAALAVNEVLAIRSESRQAVRIQV